MQIFDYFLVITQLLKRQNRKIVKITQKINRDELPLQSDAISHFYEEDTKKRTKHRGREDSLNTKHSQTKKHTTLRPTTILIKLFFKCKCPQ